MTKIHQEIDDWLAADLYGELSDTDRNAFHSHLVECETCRRVHQENSSMDKMLNETLANAKPDLRFEQRMLAGFRNRIPLRAGGFGNFVVGLARMRWARAAAAIVILALLVPFGAVTKLSMRGPVPAERPIAMADRSEVDQRQMLAQAIFDRQNNPYIKGQVANSRSSSAVPQPAPTPLVAKFKEESGGLAASSPGDRDRVIVTGSGIPIAEEVASTVAGKVEPSSAESATAEAGPPPEVANRKLIRNATVDLEIVSFDQALQKITGLANQAHGYIATTSSEKQANGKLKGEIVVKVAPENLDGFLQSIRGLGELKNQTLGTQDITKAYFDIDARLKNARVMEQRLVDMLKKKSDDINDLLQVEKELGRVREEIEKMQGDLKFWDSQVQFATVTISLAEKDLEEPAAFRLKERAQLALYSPEVEKVYNDIKAVASPKVQITNAQLNRDNTGQVSARISILIAPEESDAVIAKIKEMGRVENFQVQTERVAQDGNGMSENAKTKRDKVELNITISRDEQEQALQQTQLRIRTSGVDEKTKALRELAQKQGGRVRTSSFGRDPNGRESADVSIRVPMKNYPAVMKSLDTLGRVEDASVQRQDRPNTVTDEANAPADISIQIYSQGNLVSPDNGLFATLRHTLGEGVAALMWSLRMIGVALAFLAPWAVAAALVIWIVRRARTR